ncbi:general stress protein 26 [Friedmanniella endophytica]|jgi:general stress protein 26|uniref:General stress protein 26 n=1 Tax=Microlunatus kandeliicorticis TaxID=1759536 RepID=A0A7W3P791_9ACTN|nr:pyridoxamine 5'-phosphate oxidase family protein [Microlunatus kandeliicorticis]MBA8795732.1 general stress protein 26 [Microlunatus kandeliicorticis]
MSDEPNNQDEGVQKVAELLDKARIALVTTVGPEGQLLSRPLAVQEHEFDGNVYFLVPDPSPKTEQIRSNPQVNVAVEAGNGWLSLAGTGTVSKDAALIDQLWNTAAEAWFDQGREDPAVSVLTVHADSAEYWTSNTPKPLALLKYAKAAATGGQPNIGESGKVDL